MAADFSDGPRPYMIHEKFSELLTRKRLTVS